MTLVLFRNKDTGACFPSRPELADACGYADRTIDKALAGLEGAGWLNVDRAERGGRGHTNHYTFTPGKGEPRSRIQARETANHVRGYAQERANETPVNSEPRSPEVVLQEENQRPLHNARETNGSTPAHLTEQQIAEYEASDNPFAKQLGEAARRTLRSSENARAEEAPTVAGEFAEDAS